MDVSVKTDPSTGYLISPSPKSQLTELEKLVADLTDRKGRRPRILHVGNIANNAYNNAKLLTKYGFECDVLCNDYYHVMGCPEWEDADFEGAVEDHFRPDWSRIKLRGFQRQRWFVQGKLKTCFAYLYALNREDNSRAIDLWRQLSQENGTASQTSEGNDSRYFTALFNWLSWPVCLGRLASLAKSFAMRAPDYLRALQRPESVGRFVTRLSHATHKYTWLQPVARPFWKFVDTVARSMSVGFLLLLSVGRAPRLTRSQLGHHIKSFRRRFPERSDDLTLIDVIPYVSDLRYWKSLFEQYDIVQTYATNSIVPFLIGHPFIAFEHGTLRDIPFEDSSTGRLTALSFANAEHVFVTNADCLESARYLTGSNNKFTFINHPYDEDHSRMTTGVQELRAEICEQLKAEWVVFFPTRHDWIPDTGYADKSNDVFIRAFAALQARGLRLGMVCCKWGANVDASQKLIKQLGCEAFVKWVEPLGVVAFDRMCMAADVVADQFKLGSFGGVAFKAMATGCPVLSSLDKADVARIYQEPPPILSCSSEDEIIDCLEKLFSDQVFRDKVSTKSRCWTKRNHSGEAVVFAQAKVYQNFLSSQGSIL